ncbi:uncharacterized protein traf3ip2b isoform X2 [Salminus brasiliensis]|uniref:uncharacterized protein traf3ip2b isoform X2 n=1 Tax=Salminus brasiliensis TaxID=930266 RepID=UPI003B838910
MACHNQQCRSLNCPEENDETLSEHFQSEHLARFQNPKASPQASRTMEGQPFNQQHYPLLSDLARPPHDNFSGYIQQAPYPSHAGASGIDPEAHCAWNYSSYRSRNSEGCYTNSLPPYLPSTDYQSYPGHGCFLPSGPHSLPGRHSPSLGSLELPRSLHSFPPGLPMHTHHAMAFPGLPPNQPCYGQCGPVPLQMRHHLSPGPGYHLPYRRGPEHYRHGHAGSTENEDVSPRPRQASPCSSQLSQEQRKKASFYKILEEHCCEDLIAFSNKSVSVVRMLDDHHPTSSSSPWLIWEHHQSREQFFHCSTAQCWGALYPSSLRLALFYCQYFSTGTRPAVCVCVCAFSHQYQQCVQL